ncbi:hypothetical protein QTP86_018266, partial [Hemibagrus guttatus]
LGTTAQVSLPKEYNDLREVFSKEKATHLPPHRPWDCALELLPNTMPPKNRVYTLSLPESKAMEEYIEEVLDAGYIHPSTSPTVSGFFFVSKKDGVLRPCIEYRGLNAIMGAGGNWATVGRRSRGGRRVRRQREKRKGKSVGLRIGTLNVGTMTGKGRELADVMERRKVDILCVQETRWKGSKARSIGAGFKLFYYGVDSKRNGVGVVLKEEFVRNVLEVKRVSDRVMSLKLEFEGVMLNVVSGYAPQVGCELEEKERFWSELNEVMESIPTGERVVIGADFNGHVGEGNTGDEEVMGKFGVKEWNLEGQMVVDFAKRMDMGVVNTYFQKREEHRVTYKSGGRSTQVDYILCRRGNLKEISDCKVVVGESVARQHRMVVCRMTLMVCKKKRKEDKETWWWNEEVQDSIQRKRLAKKKWDMDRTEENRQEYKELQRRVKREVSKAKQKAYDELYTRLDTREGEKDLYRLARQRDRDGKDVQQVRVIKDRDGRVLTSEESVQRRWKENFEELMNEENEREKRVEGVNSVEQKVDKIRKDEVRKALKRMKSGKAVGPDDIPVEVWKCLGEAAVEFLATLFNRVLDSERMPEEWRRSVLVPIFKNKGDVQSCSNYSGIKLMSHTMKVWERVVEARLRKVVEICEQQYGFMPRKSTTDAIFALRILMEKYRDGQRELHCVFVDLEKAYDRVPREELWYCMRKSGVAEKYVRVVQDMYERSRTVVRCAVGQTEEFNVEVGLHQGSALSPFLFAIVMDQLSEEVRQESPWTMMFADDIVICSESREQVEENLERWRFALERRGMKVSRSKTEYMCVNEREGSGTVRLQGEEVKKVQEFKYLGSTVQSNGECGKEVKKRVQAGWNGWRKVSGVLCDQKISARIKGKVYRTVVRPAMLYGLETVSLRKRQESELEDCFKCTDWDMFREAATNGDTTDLEEYTSSVTNYISKCIDDVSISKSITTRSNQKPWMTTKVCALLKSRGSAFRAGDKDTLSTARAKLFQAIREAKRTYSPRIHGHFQSSGDTRRMWQGIQSITNYRPAPPACDSDASLPDALNRFYPRFEAQNDVMARKTIPHPEDQVLCLTTADVRNTLCRVNPRKAAGPDNIPGRVLRECAEQLADVFTDIFNISLSSTIVPTCLKTTTIIPSVVSMTTVPLHSHSSS